MSRKAWDSQNVGPRKASTDMGPGDPAFGAKVPRCFRCGMPDRPTYKLYSGMWSHLRFHMDFMLCGQCIEELALRQNADPLTLDEVA